MSSRKPARSSFISPLFIFPFIFLLWLPSADSEAHEKPVSPFARQITPENFHQAIRGPDAIAGVGDWMLSNGTLCASITDPSHETYLSDRGGTLVDLGFCGRQDDHWNTWHELFNLSRDTILPANRIYAEQDEEGATVVVTGLMAGVENETRYRLNLEHPTELDIETRLTRVSRADRLFLFGELTLHPHRSLTPFSLSTSHPAQSPGFQHPFVNTDDKMAMLKVMLPTDLQVLVGPEESSTEISYGIQALSSEYINNEGTRIPLRQFAINNDEFTLMGSFVNPLWFDTNRSPGLLQFAQILFMDLAVGETLLLKKRILVTPRNDVAAITDQIYQGAVISGQTDNPDNRILVTDTSDHPLTVVKPDSHGLFRFRLPAAMTEAKVVLNEPGHDSSKTEVIHSQNHSIVLDSTDTLAVLELPKGHIMQLVFKGRDGTEDPVLFPDTLNFRVGDRRFQRAVSANRISLTNTPEDIDELSLLPGHYSVYAIRGPEYSLSHTEIDLKAGEHSTLVIEAPQHTVESPHWIAADLHVHSEYSFDSTLPAHRRIADFVAQGGEVLVSSEHKRTVDFSIPIREMHLQNQIVAITGVELTSMAHTKKIPRTTGHSNVFPLVEDQQAYLGGTLPHENLRLGEIISAYKKKYPDSVFQLNHPRASQTPDADINYLDHLSIDKAYDPNLPLDNPQNSSLLEPLPGSTYRDMDFDAMELLNGEDMASYARVRTDWFSFLRQGYRKTGTANSDSHDASHLVAIPRNYVRVKDDAVSSFVMEDFLASLHKGDVFGSTGPLLDIRLGGKHMGETFTGTSGDLTVEIRSADWIPVDTLTVYVNGAMAYQQKIPGAGTYHVPLGFTKNSFVTVEVQGAATKDYAAVYPGFYPFAFSNPVYVALK